MLFLYVDENEAVGMEDGISFWLATAKWEPFANAPIITHQKDPILIFLLIIEQLTRFHYDKSFLDYCSKKYPE